MKVPQFLLGGATAIVLLSHGLFSVSAQQNSAAAAPNQQDTTAASSQSAVDPGAMAAMDRMSAALRTHNDFAIAADVTNEDVLASGQKLQYGGKLDIRARRPDRFKVSIVSDAKDREIYYDGKDVTVFSPRLSMYASFPAPPTIKQTIDTAQKKYGIELPLADLFTWGTDKTPAARITSAFLVRPETIDGHACNHYAFRQKNVDWEIWVAQDDSALPYKLVITDTTDPSMPQYTAMLHWNFPDRLDDGAFAFSPPSGARKIVMADLDTIQKERAQQ